MAKIAFLFPGQGAHYVGMGKNLYQSFAEARETFEEANQVLGFDLKKLCFEGNMDELTKTENTQPAILTVSVAAYRVYMKEIGVKPDLMAGHSLGEISALCSAGALTFPDALRIVRQRGRFMQEAVAPGSGGMAAVNGVPLSIVAEVCQRVSTETDLVVVSNYNSQNQIVISGHQKALREAGERLKTAGATVIPLTVSAPFHSPLMKPAADRLKLELEKYTFSQLKYPVISNVTAEPYPDQDSIKDYLTKQLVHGVRWLDSMEYLIAQGVELTVELGPQTVLRNLMKRIAPQIKSYAYDDATDRRALKTELTVVEQQPEQIKKGMDFIIKCIAEAICTKNNNHDEQEYQKGVVEPYRQVTRMKEEIEKANREPTAAEIRSAFEMLKTVFNTKKVPDDEQVARFKDLFATTQIKGVFNDFEY